MAHKEFKFMSHMLIRQTSQEGNECANCIFYSSKARNKHGKCKLVYWANNPQSKKKYNLDTFPCTEKGKSYIFIKKPIK
jgi:hypothetical protein